MPDTLIGQTIGNCQIVSEIGRGGMAVVYKAHQTSLNRYVAIKVLPPYFQHAVEFLARFKQEALSAAKLQHPNIVQIYETGEWNGYHFIVMEYVDGEPLNVFMQRRGGPLDLPTAVNLLSQIGAALDFAHSQGVVHRDVKPSNILIDRQGRALLTDFGIAKAAESTRLTQTGASIGTPEYMSPEQVEGEPADARSDLYSLGVVLYQMLTGHVPFTGATPTAILYSHVHKLPPAPRTFNPALTAPVEALVLRALAKRKEKRFTSGGEMVRALHAASAGTALGHVQPHIVKRSNVLAPVVIATLTALMILVGVFVVALGLDGRTPTPVNVPVAGINSTLVAERQMVATELTATLTPTTTLTSTPTPTITNTPTITKTPTPSRTPTSTPTATPLPRGTLVFSDDFNDPRSRLGRISSDGGHGYTNGQYRIFFKPGEHSKTYYPLTLRTRQWELV